MKAPFLVGLCDKEDRLTKESYHSDSVDEVKSYQYNERNELTKRTVTGQYYLRARYYNPVMYYDPSGHFEHGNG